MAYRILQEGRDDMDYRGLDPEMKEDIKELIYECLEKMEREKMGHRDVGGRSGGGMSYRHYDDDYDRGEIDERRGVRGSGRGRR